MADSYKKFMASYNFEGERWSFDFDAKSFEDAERRLKAMVWAKLDGELKGPPIPASLGYGLVPLYCVFRNWLKARALR